MTTLQRQVCIFATLFLLIDKCVSQTINLSTINNVVYVDLPNPITSNITGQTCKNIIFETDNGIIEKNNCNLTFTPNKVGPTKIEIFTLSNGKKVKIGESIFRARQISDPYARYAGQSSGKISKEIVKVNDGLSLFHIPELECQPGFSVDKYSIIIIKSNDSVLKTENKGAKFEAATVDIMKKLDKGDLLIFSQIIVKTPDNIQRRVNPVEFIIE